MDTLKSTPILALIMLRNPYHIISIQGQYNKLLRTQQKLRNKKK